MYSFIIVIDVQHVRVRQRPFDAYAKSIHAHL